MAHKQHSTIIRQRKTESVAQSNGSRSQKPKLSMIECGHQMDGWPLCARLSAHPEISPESNAAQILQKLFGQDYEPRFPLPPPPPPCMQKRSPTHVKDPVVHVRVPWTMEATK